MLNHKVASTPLRSSFAENIRCATYPPPPGSAPGYQLAHQFTARYVNKVIAGIHTESSSGKNESREPTCALEASSAVILDFRSEPTCPPIHRKIREQGDCRHPYRVELRKKRKPRTNLRARGVKRGDLRLQSIHSTDSVHRKNREHNHHAHLEHELEQVGDQHPPQPGYGRVKRGEDQYPDNNHNSAALIKTQRRLEYLYHRQIDPTHDDAVNRQSQVQSPEAPEKCRGLA